MYLTTYNLQKNVYQLKFKSLLSEMNCALRYAYTILFRTIFGYIARFYRKNKDAERGSWGILCLIFNALLMRFRPKLCINNHRKVGFLFSISTEVQDNYLHFMRVLTAFDWYVICKIHGKHRWRFN